MNRALASSAKPNAHDQIFDTQANDYWNADATDRILRTRIFADLIRVHPRLRSICDHQRSNKINNKALPINH